MKAVDRFLESSAPLTSPRERIIHLRSLPEFGVVPLEDIFTLAQHLEDELFPRGATIVSSDEPLNSAFFLVEGRVALRNGSETVATLDAPDAIGILSILAELDHAPGDVVAETDAILLRVSADALLHVWETNPELMANTIRGVAADILAERRGMPFDPDNPPDPTAGLRPEAELDFVQKLQWQLAAPPYLHANLDALADLARQLEEVQFSAGDRMWEAGDDADGFLGIVYGTVYCESDDGTERGAVGAGYNLGMLNTLAGQPHQYSALAETDIVALRTDRDRLFELLDDQFQLAMNMLQALTALITDHRQLNVKRRP